MGKVKKHFLRKKLFIIRSSLFKLRAFQYFKAIWHILFRIQPYFSIFLALLISVPIALAFTTGINTMLNDREQITYKEGVIGSINSIDPLPLVNTDRPFSQLNRDITRLMFDPLFTTDKSGQLVGILASSYDIQNNGNVIAIKLRDRLWSDGHSFTSKDVQLTFNTIKALGPSCLYYASIEGIDINIIDEHSLTFKLTVPNSSFIESLYWPVLPSSVLISKYADLLNSNFTKNPITDTGWLIKEFTDKYVLLKSLQNKYLKFNFYNNSTELSKALNAAEINGYYSLDTVSERNYLTINKFILPRQTYSLYFNVSDTGSPIIKDPNIRKAISYAINRNEVTSSLGLIRQSVIQSDSWAFNNNVNTYSYNLDMANKILDTARYKKNGDYRKYSNSLDLSFKLTIPDIKARILQAEIIRDQMKKIGIKVDLITVKNTQIIDNNLKQNIFYNSVVLPQQFETMIYSIDSNLDPDKFTQWHSSKIPNLEKNIIGLNFTGYSNVRVDAFLKQGHIQADQAIRQNYYYQFEKVFYDEPPVVTLYNPYVFYITSKKVRNIDFSSAIKIEDRFTNFDSWVF